jgi:putative transposase
MRIREIAQTRVRYGYRKIQVLLKREGREVGKSLMRRLSREEGLELKQRPNRRQRAAEHTRERVRATATNQIWSLDSMADQLTDGRRFRVLTIVPSWMCTPGKAWPWKYEQGRCGRSAQSDPCPTRGSEDALL